MNRASDAPDLAERAAPRVALTLGDVAGIGPEIVARLWGPRPEGSRPLQPHVPFIVGCPVVVERALKLVGLSLPVRLIDTPSDLDDPQPGVPVWNPVSIDVTGVSPGTVDGRAGRAANDWLVAATRAALEGTVDAIVTAPLNKYALREGGIDLPGHTEILARECGVARSAMMLWLPPGPTIRAPNGLGVVNTTLHTSIRSVPELLSTDRIEAAIQLLDGFLKRVATPNPRLGVCALNPHAGEGGLFGDEEARLIAPAVARAQGDGIRASGPFPADTLLLRACGGEFDGVVAMYHDQGHIALKLVAFNRAVNVTLGLPIVRTSPSHGTAFDIAWGGTASADGLRGALDVAIRLVCGNA
jgi:4-phospho-D-threonate 3-dehydrogenase / 4-phospho-D-erythronate 3-dehydrogenase